MSQAVGLFLAQFYIRGNEAEGTLNWCQIRINIPSKIITPGHLVEVLSMSFWPCSCRPRATLCASKLQAALKLVWMVLVLEDCIFIFWFSTSYQNLQVQKWWSSFFNAPACICWRLGQLANQWLLRIKPIYLLMQWLGVECLGTLLVKVLWE